MIERIAIISVLALALLSACGDKKPDAPVKVTKVAGIYLVCLNGHEYYLRRVGMASRLNDDGTPYKCDTELGRNQ